VKTGSLLNRFKLHKRNRFWHNKNVFLPFCPHQACCTGFLSFIYYASFNFLLELSVDMARKILPSVGNRDDATGMFWRWKLTAGGVQIRDEVRQPATAGIKTWTRLSRCSVEITL